MYVADENNTDTLNSILDDLFYAKSTQLLTDQKAEQLDWDIEDVKNRIVELTVGGGPVRPGLVR